jgi:hypothetical protein
MDYESMVVLIGSLVGVILVLTGWLVYEGRLVDRGCPSCVHCTARQKKAEGNSQDRERLFGREIEDVDANEDEKE